MTAMNAPLDKHQEVLPLVSMIRQLGYIPHPQHQVLHLAVLHAARFTENLSTCHAAVITVAMTKHLTL